MFNVTILVFGSDLSNVIQNNFVNKKFSFADVATNTDTIGNRYW
jgi:hypothetical protein